MLLVSLAPGHAHAQAMVKFPGRVCEVSDYAAPASGTRIQYDTAAIQKAIDVCAQAGGGTVRLRRGSWLTGPLFLRSNIRLQLDRGAELVAATDDALFRKTTGTAAWAANSYLATLNIADAENVAVTGEGRIDGQGAVWWEKWRAQTRATGTRPGADRPRLVYVVRSRNVLLQGVKFYNSPSFHLVFKDSENITVRGVGIQALAHSPNTDAIDPIDTRNVLIENNLIDMGDDVVAIKSSHVDPRHPDAASANIVIRNNTILAGRGISIGSETIGGVRNVLVENNVTSDAMYGIRIKTPRGRGGPVRDIVFRNNRMTNVATPFVFASYYDARPADDGVLARQLAAGGFLLNDQVYPPDSDPARPFAANQTPAVSNVTVDGLTATGAERIGVIVGLPERPIEGLRLQRVKVSADTGLLVRNAQVALAGAAFTAAQGPAVRRERGAEVTVAPPARRSKKNP
jgi:polygalacturonase